MEDINPYESPQTENSLPAKPGNSKVLLRVTAYIAASPIGAKLGGLLNSANRIIVIPEDSSGYWAEAFFGGLAGLVIVLIASHSVSKRINKVPKGALRNEPVALFSRI